MFEHRIVVAAVCMFTTILLAGSMLLWIDTAHAVQDFGTEGTEKPLQLVIQGDASAGSEVQILVTAAADLAGVYADIRAEGLELISISNSMCASHGLVLLPQLGMDHVSYTYRVVGKPGCCISFVLSNVTVGVGTDNVHASTLEWTCEVPSVPIPKSNTEPLQTVLHDPVCSAEAAPAALAADDSVRNSIDIQGPDQAVYGDCISIIAKSNAELDASISVTGLTLESFSSVLGGSGRLHLLPAPGLDLAVFTYRVSGLPGTLAELRVGRFVMWSLPITPASVGKNMAELPIIETSHGTWALYDWAASDHELLCSEFVTYIHPKPATTVLVLAPDLSSKAADSVVENGDWFEIRSQAHETVRGRIILVGDVCSSGRLDITQLVTLAQLLTLQPNDEKQRLSADINRNGSLDIGDLVQLCRCLS